MDLDTVVEMARKEEDRISRIIRYVAQIDERDSMVNWFKRALEREPDLAEYFELPTTPEVADAFLSILGSNSTITAPIVGLLTNRLHVYLSTVPELAEHEMAGKEIREIDGKFRYLRSLIDKYRSSRKRRSLHSVADAVRARRLHVFKDGWHNTALRVVLRAFYEADGPPNSEDQQLLLGFILDQLLEERDHAGHIPERRHAWWAVFTLADTATQQWLRENAEEIEGILDHLLSLPAYSPRQDVAKKSIAPELHTERTERLWVTINTTRLLRSPLRDIISDTLRQRLGNKLSQNVDIIIGSNAKRSFKYSTIRLLLFYELIKHYTYLRTQTILDKNSLNIKNKQIGQLYYNEKVNESVSDLLISAEKYICSEMEWTSNSSTSAIICGRPGQGKSELINQLHEEISRLVDKTGFSLERGQHTVGDDIRSKDDLHEILDQYKSSVQQRQEIVTFISFDEVDKADDFNFFTPFLSLLEGSIKPPGAAPTFWVFAQSSFSTFKELRSFAEGKEDKSLRDFLTRMQWGHIELPDLRYSPEQRLLSGIGVVLDQFDDIGHLSVEWAAYFLSNFTIRNIRTLVNEAETRSGLSDKSALILRDDADIHDLATPDSNERQLISLNK